MSTVDSVKEGISKYGDSLPTQWRKKAAATNSFSKSPLSSMKPNSKFALHEKIAHQGGLH